MPPPTINCVHCSKACKISDSRYYPNSKSKDRIHNRCYLKKSVADKLKPADNDDKSNHEKPIAGGSTSAPESKTSSVDLMKKLDEDHEKLKADAQSRKLKQLISEQEEKSLKEREKASFFFDVKAGIAKPHETRRYLSHRNLSEMVPRYDDHGFQSESLGRAYDHTGKDLNSLGDDSDEEAVADQPKAQSESAHVETKKRKQGYDDGKKTKRVSHASVDLNEKSCWFCLSSPEVEKHLIVAIGNHCYLTLAKGGLVDEHFLLIPIEHIQSLHSKENSAELRDELAQFKSSLIEYFKKKSLGVIFFERNFRSVHWQLQVIPMPMSKIHGVSSGIKSLSKKHYNKSDYLDIPSNCSLSDVIPPGSPYLYWRVEPLRERFVSKIELAGSFFPVQLPRIILADSEIMDCKERIDWKKCTKTNEEYTQLVRRIKIEYSEFDFT